MRKYIKSAIDDMRLKGMSSSAIASAVGLPVNTVKSHIYRHPEIPRIKLCAYCGRPMRQPKGRKQKKFCSDKCRITYWNHHYRKGGLTDEGQ